MARVKGVYKPSDCPSAETQQELTELFARLFPGRENPQFGPGQTPWAIMSAQSPQLLRLVLDLGYYLRDSGWQQRSDLKELAHQTVNYHYKADFAFQAHLNFAESSGLGVNRIAAIPYWRTASSFSEQQRLVIEYTLAVCRGDVPDELFGRVTEEFGEKGTIEFTASIGFWSLWATFNNAFRPEWTQ